MACSKYVSTKETTNAARLSRLLLDPCTDLFRDILRTFITEAQFPYALPNHKASLLRIINKDHRNLLYPRSGPFSGTYNEFDLSLLYILLRNISGIPPHKNGWGKHPDPTDRSLSANIDRIRETRNTYCGHAPRVTLSDKDFQKIWQEMAVIIRELEGCLPRGCTTYTAAANLIKTDTMDPEQERTLLDVIDQQHQVWEDIKDTTTEIIKQQNKLHQEHQQLRAEQDGLKFGLQEQGLDFRFQLQRQKMKLTYEQERQDKELKDVLHKHEIKMEFEQEKLDKELKTALQIQGKDLSVEIEKQSLELNMEQQMQKMGLQVMTKRLSVLENYSDCERKNILDNTAAIMKSIKSRGVYIRTSAVDRIMEKLKENRIVILTGKAGTGKTTTAYHVMCEMSDESLDSPYTPVVINSPDEWNKVVNPYQQFIVFLDDFIGSTNLDKIAVEKWKSKLDAISACVTNGHVFVLIGLRRTILDEAQNYLMQSFFHDTNVIDLSMEQNLTTEDKQKMFDAFNAKCNLKDAIEVVPEDRMEIICSDPYYGFPLTCFQFFSRLEFYQLGPSYFLRPSELLYNAIECMRKSKSVDIEKVSYCILCYVFLQGHIKKNDISYDLFESICEKVRISNVHDIDISDAIDDLNGVYLSDIKTKHVYEFSHETVLETVLVSFGQLAPDIIIKQCSRKTFHELIRTQNYESKPGEVVLKIPKRHFEDLAQRMLRGDDGDGIEDEDFSNIAITLFMHPACHDLEFVSVLLNRDVSNRFWRIVAMFWDGLPWNLSTDGTLLKMILEYYGPHHITSESSQMCGQTSGKKQ